MTKKIAAIDESENLVGEKEQRYPKLELGVWFDSLRSINTLSVI